MSDRILPSWRDGATRAAIVDFLDQVDQIPPAERVAVFDNDGTMWCEKPQYTQAEFLMWELQRAVADDPTIVGAVSTLAFGEVAVHGDLVYLADGVSSLKIISRSSPKSET